MSFRVESNTVTGGPTHIHVDYDPADLGHLTQGNGIAVVEMRDATASAEGAFALGSRVAAGAYEYELHQGGVDGDAADGNWYLRLDDDTPTPPVDNEVPNYRVEVPVDMVLPALAHRLGLDTLGTYHDRAGEHYLPAGFRATPVDARGRPTQDEQRGWARVFGRSGKVGGSTASEASRYRWFEKNGPRYEFDLSGLQVGLDVHREVDEEGTREVAGGYLAVTQASAQVEAVLGGRAGKASMKGYSLGGYWTRMAASGAYVDGVLQFTDYQGVSARSVRGVEISPDGWGIAASLEAGHAFEPVAHWHFEPQVQLVYQVVSMGGTRDDFGRIRYGDAEAVYGRLGMRLVRNGETDEGQRYTFWGRFNVWQQFGGKAKTSFASLGGGNRVALGTTLGGTWAQLGLGLNAQLSRSVNGFVSADYEQNLSFDASRSIGARVGVQVTW
ncbi:autotransporter outer membrane beta-barrel domain-containing protein [Caldimonas thermodepolymerans]|uniref:Outer membrane autotransporter protein n=1 Tax=Caldimonas thermodepolymerans TaxID=215580 RepID=A0AA46DGX6_9BURK|nr:autotransporter outer membrane beta-barrel domain-containing protein [Caldimonas thermodepolymerans]TCP09910.1 outer membrane autotransporter protein [Caldimonas thermodepolymerans]UZG46299.1 autotransporter outer membrane beta-barrel domain-containing protein [Caldimonas thermodepolymerans]